MRAVRLILATTFSVALLAVVSTTGVAQSEDSPLVVPVTGELTGMASVAGADHTSDRVGPAKEYRHFEYDWTIDWSDPRLPVHLRSRQNANQYPPSDVNAPTRPEVRRFAVADDAGAWVGTATVVMDEDGVISGQMVLEGTGVNDGLVAILGVNADPGAYTEWDGFLVQGELPPLPEPPMPDMPAE